ncbi:MAG TPA: hypothetical protein VLH56_19140 [Dissulfurispiraceae bacterium]|nr:hypothetical protein [Dissulfurispiraceae bacterium]
MPPKLSTIYFGDCPPEITAPGKRITAAALDQLIPAIHARPFQTSREILLGGWFISCVADLLVVQPGRLHGYETKSNGDSVTRIPKQVINYLGQCHSLTFIAEHKIAGRVEKCLRRIENGWDEGKSYPIHHGGYPADQIGLIVATAKGTGYEFEVVRRATEIMPENEAFLLSAYGPDLRAHRIVKALKLQNRGKIDQIKAIAAEISQEEAADFVAEIMWRRCDDPPNPSPPYPREPECNEIMLACAAQRGLFI